MTTLLQRVRNKLTATVELLHAATQQRVSTNDTPSHILLKLIRSLSEYASALSMRRPTHSEGGQPDSVVGTHSCFERLAKILRKTTSGFVFNFLVVRFPHVSYSKVPCSFTQGQQAEEYGVINLPETGITVTGGASEENLSQRINSRGPMRMLSQHCHENHRSSAL